MPQLPRNPTRPVQYWLADRSAMATRSPCRACAQPSPADVEDDRSPKSKHLVKAGNGRHIRVAVDTKHRRRGPGRNSQTDKRQLSSRSVRNLSPGNRNGPQRQTRSATTPATYTITSESGRGRRSEVSRRYGRRRRCSPIRVGVDSGSLDPAQRESSHEDDLSPMLDRAREHCELLDKLGFTLRVSLEELRPGRRVEANGPSPTAPRRAAAPRRDRAGMPPEGIVKTQRPSSTYRGGHRRHDPRSLDRPVREGQEIKAGRKSSTTLPRAASSGWLRGAAQAEHHLVPQLLARGEFRFRRPGGEGTRGHGYRPAIDLDRRDWPPVNGPGETDMTDLGLWCGPKHVNLKRGEATLGSFTYDEILPRLKQELDALIAAKSACMHIPSASRCITLQTGSPSGEGGRYS